MVDKGPTPALIALGGDKPAADYLRRRGYGPAVVQALLSASDERRREVVKARRSTFGGTWDEARQVYLTTAIGHRLSTGFRAAYAEAALDRANPFEMVLGSAYLALLDAGQKHALPDTEFDRGIMTFGPEPASAKALRQHPEIHGHPSLTFGNMLSGQVWQDLGQSGFRVKAAGGAFELTDGSRHPARWEAVPAALRAGYGRPVLRITEDLRLHFELCEFLHWDSVDDAALRQIDATDITPLPWRLSIASDVLCAAEGITRRGDDEHRRRPNWFRPRGKRRQWGAFFEATLTAFAASAKNPEGVGLFAEYAHEQRFGRMCDRFREVILAPPESYKPMPDTAPQLVVWSSQFESPTAEDYAHWRGRRVKARLR